MKTDKEVNKYIEKQKSPQKEILKLLREIIFKTSPKINEECRLGVPCYGYTKEEPCGKYYIVALRDHVNMGFTLKGLSKPEQELFEGSGKTMKHIAVSSVGDLDEKRIVKLVKLVEKRSK